LTRKDIQVHTYLDKYGGFVAVLKLTQVGTSTGIVIPKEMLNRLKVGRGDTLFAIETPSGYLITPYDPDVEEELRLGREFMLKYRETFKALAK
jgi:putative addiction module antidote